jgi:hypothetical protein
MAGTATRGLLAAGAVLMLAACGSSAAPTSTPATKPPAQPRATTTTTRKPSDTTHTALELKATTGVTPAELARADHLLHSTISGLAEWNTPARAQAAGYRSIGDGVTGDEHFVNWSYVDDGHILDPKRPESLVYENRNGRQSVVAAMYMLPFGSNFSDVPDVGGGLTQWHVHADLCLTNDPNQKFVAGFAALNGPCPAGTTKAGDQPMLHVWRVPNPCGPFAALEGVGAGQVPTGQTRLCDTTNARVP